jgi:hypothetical protein
MIKRQRNNFDLNAYNRILAIMGTPKTAKQLAIELGTTSQMINAKLLVLWKNELVTREILEGHERRFIYLGIKKTCTVDDLKILDVHKSKLIEEYLVLAGSVLISFDSKEMREKLNQTQRQSRINKTVNHYVSGSTLSVNA